MSADTAIRFRDPFSSQPGRRTHQEYNTHPWPSYGLGGPLTPPSDMNTVAHPHNNTQLPREHVHQHLDPVSSYPAHRGGPSTHLPVPYSAGDYSRHSTQPSSRTHSPEFLSQPPTSNMDHSRPTHSRKGSQAAIAPSFQIPKSINDSGGSLSELAAQMTCLFWFESSEILQQIEDSSLPFLPAAHLVADARPSTGFRKWVTTILSTTCVAQNVVLLALLFIHRLKKLNPSVRGKSGSEYRLLTVALMLGNKFLDDNTYTNKTWAEVSGITVSEVHIMEVEFLSNMKYCLFTSAEDWSRWQSLLGKFAAFFDRASRPISLAGAPSLLPTSSLHLPMSLPSPPSSNQASPPYATNMANTSVGFGNGITPAPSPMHSQADSNALYTNARKRSRDEWTPAEPPAKRSTTGYQGYPTAQQYPSNSLQSVTNSRPTLPSLPVPIQTPVNYCQPSPQDYQLPPLSVPGRAMALAFPGSSAQTPFTTLPAVSGMPSSQPQPRQELGYPGSAGGSPMSNFPLPATALQPPTQLSPTHFYLQQRNSPYRPVHNVSTLMNPPPTSALQNAPQNIEHDQMQFQPLGKPFRQRQVGRLPYVKQNVYLDSNTPQAMTPVAQWPSFAAAQTMHARNTQH